MNRRDFITLLGGAAAAWPLAARAQQQGERMRRVGVLVGFSDADQARQGDIVAFREALVKLGWVEGRNLRLDIRYGGADATRVHELAVELVGLSPDAIVTASGVAMRAVQQQTQTIPIIISGAGDPEASGFVRNIARPEGNTTGITNLYASIGGKWLELLKQAFPLLERVALLYDPQLNTDPGGVYMPSAEEAARALGVKAARVPFRDTLDIVRAIDAFAAEPNGGVIVMPPPPNAANRETIRRLAVEHRLPTMYHAGQYAVEGGLMAYGSNQVDRMRRSASFVDRILRGAKVSDLPLEFPTRFELTINLKTAKAIGLSIPPTLLVTADEVIEQ
jgi:putative ABC transport system substrate-binding protein